MFLHLSQISSYYKKQLKKITEMMSLTLLVHWHINNILLLPDYVRNIKLYSHSWTLGLVCRITTITLSNIPRHCILCIKVKAGVLDFILEKYSGKALFCFFFSQCLVALTSGNKRPNIFDASSVVKELVPGPQEHMERFRRVLSCKGCWEWAHIHWA